MTAGIDDPRAFWEEFFTKRNPDGDEVASTLLKLHEAGRHEHVIAAIEAALRHGKVQPWMYDVLALSMQVAGRPEEDVERVLLSRIDFTAADVPNMVLSAAYLVRFGANDRALALYQQAAELDPTRPEPYVLGLDLAVKARDYERIEWAATGVLTTVWGEDQKRHHDRARDATRDAARDLRKEGRDEDARRLEAAVADARRRDLALKLTWSGPGNLDLIVEEPAGTVCSFDNRRTRGGGVLVHEGYGPEQDNCFEEYVCASGVAGSYRVRIRHLWGNVVGNRARLEVLRYEGTEKESKQVFTIPLDRKEKVVRINLAKGRRRELATFVPAELRISRTPGGMTPVPGREEERAARRFVRSRTGGAVPAGFTPVTTVLNEGVTASALAVVSGDRRYVRLTVAPAFTTVTDVFTFPFVGGGGAAPGGGAAGQGPGPQN